MGWGITNCLGKIGDVLGTSLSGEFVLIGCGMVSFLAICIFQDARDSERLRDVLLELLLIGVILLLKGNHGTIWIVLTTIIHPHH